MDFKHPDGSNINEVDIDAEIYHYGWVRPPETMIKKRVDFDRLYNKSDEEVKKFAEQVQNFDDLGNLKQFTEAHPKVMLDRIGDSKWDFDAKMDQQPPDWLRKIFIFMHPVTKRLKRMFK
jgi:hypothetical protein